MEKNLEGLSLKDYSYNRSSRRKSYVPDLGLEGWINTYTFGPYWRWLLYLGDPKDFSELQNSPGYVRVVRVTQRTVWVERVAPPICPECGELMESRSMLEVSADACCLGVSGPDFLTAEPFMTLGLNVEDALTAAALNNLAATA